MGRGTWERVGLVPTSSAPEIMRPLKPGPSSKIVSHAGRAWARGERVRSLGVTQVLTPVLASAPPQT